MNRKKKLEEESIKRFEERENERRHEEESSQRNENLTDFEFEGDYFHLRRYEIKYSYHKGECQQCKKKVETEHPKIIIVEAESLYEEVVPPKMIKKMNKDEKLAVFLLNVFKETPLCWDCIGGRIKEEVELEKKLFPFFERIREEETLDAR